MGLSKKLSSFINHEVKQKKLIVSRSLIQWQ